jgi:L-threonylcarbamoyladenylate synthase
MEYILIRTSKERVLALKEATRVILEGGIVACPTETYYALCARFDNGDTLKYLLEIKGREKDKPFPLIIGAREMLPLIAEEPDPLSYALMDSFWPGPLTLLLKAKKILSPLIRKEGKIAVRIPGDSFALELAKEIGVPLTATSANTTGFPPAESAPDVMKYFATRIELLIDEGKPAPGRLPSTIVDATGGVLKIIREGAVTARQIETALKFKP